MSRYLNGELIDTKENKVIALMSLPNTFRDLVSNDEIRIGKPNPLENQWNYDGTHYIGFVRFSDIRECVEKYKANLYELKKQNSEYRMMLTQAKEEKAFLLIEERIRNNEEYMSDIQNNVDSCEKVMYWIEYEAEFRDDPPEVRCPGKKESMSRDDDLKLYPISGMKCDDCNTDEHQYGHGCVSCSRTWPKQRTIGIDNVVLNLWLDY